MSFSGRKASLLALAFVISLLLIDRAVLYAGNILAPTSDWKQGVLSSLSNIGDQDYYLLGTCQTAIEFDSKLIGDRTGSKVFNAGVFATGLAYIDFTLDVLLSHHRKGTVVFVLNEGMLEESNTIVPELKIYLRLSYLMDAAHEREMRVRHALSPFNLRSGFVDFRGQGYDLLKAAMKIKSGTLRSPSLDGYIPRPTGRNIMPDYSEEYLAATCRRQPFHPSAVALTLVEGFLERARAGGLRALIVIAPTRRFRTMDELNLRLDGTLRSLAAKHGAGFLSYLDNEGSMARNGSIWCTDGLLDRLGSAAFSGMFADDL